MKGNKTMKKIMILTNNLNGGGAEKVLLTLLNNLSPDEYEILLVLVFRAGEYLNDIPSYVNIKYIFENNDNASNLIFNHSDMIYKEYLKNDYDIEIAFLEGNATKILSQSTNPKSKKIAWVHIDLSTEHYTKKVYLNNQEELSAYSKFDQIAFVSEGALKGFEKIFGDSLHDKTIVIYNPIDCNDVLEKAKESLSKSDNKITFCTVGRLVPQKGYHNLIQAMGTLISEGFDFNLWILGQGKLEEELKKLCLELKLDDHVKFLGFQRNPYKFINAADAYVCSSKTEGLPLVIGESLVLKKPIISTMCCGSSEVLSKGKWGLLVECSEEGLYNGLKTFLNNTESVSVLTTESMDVYDYFYGLKMYMSRIKNIFEN